MGQNQQFFSHLRGEHVSDAVNSSSQHQTPHQETEQHHVREEGAEVHHLSESESSTLHSVAMDTLFCGFAVTLCLSRSHTHMVNESQNSFVFAWHRICEILPNVESQLLEV